ncbi:MAG: type II secretion system F family protein [Rhodospirillaceae bacterium]
MDLVVFGGLSVLLLLGVALPFIVLHQARFSETALMRRRLQALGPGGRDGAGGADLHARNRQRLIQGKIKELERQRARRKGTLGALIRQSGLALNIPGYLGLCLGAALAAGVALLLLDLGPGLCLAGAGAAGVALPRLALTLIIGRRQRLFTSLFADALDILVRGARTGLPVGECLRIVGREVPEPVGFEFRMLVESQRLGMTTEQALERGLERMPTPEYQFFAVVLTIQQQTGGNLAATLENLANVLRSRRKLRDKIAAMSSEAKASGMIIGALPFLVAGIIWILNPAYISLLFTTQTGTRMLMGGAAWMAIGVLVMYRMINFRF